MIYACGGGLSKPVFLDMNMRCLPFQIDAVQLQTLARLHLHYPILILIPVIGTTCCSSILFDSYTSCIML